MAAATPPAEHVVERAVAVVLGVQAGHGRGCFSFDEGVNEDAQY
jgi:hypothetical protein